MDKKGEEENKCPKCGSNEVVRILYGKPTKEAIEQAERGELVLGGCMRSINEAKKACKKCNTRW